MLDPRLKILQAVDYYGTVTAAAAALSYTPSAISYQLRQLSELLGVELIEPRAAASNSHRLHAPCYGTPPSCGLSGS